MRILGIVGSCRPAAESGVYQLVARVLAATGGEHDILHLRGKRIGGCTACLGCVHDNVCVVEDDLRSLRETIVAADAYVIGAPNFYSGMNAVTHAFLERWFQFRHREGNLLWGKLAVIVGVGGVTGNPVIGDVERMLAYNFIEPVATVHAQGIASCFTCGYGATCKVGIRCLLHGEGVEVSPGERPPVDRQPYAVEAAMEAGTRLGARLRSGHDRAEVARRMQAQFMAKMQESA